MSILTKINHTTKKGLGTVGRPLVVGGVTGGGAYLVGQHYDVEMLQNPYACVAVGAVCALTTEGVLRVFGDDSAMEAGESVKVVKTIQAMNDKEYEALEADVKQAYGKDSGEIIEGLQVIRNGAPTPTPSTKKVQASSNNNSGNGNNNSGNGQGNARANAS